MLINDETVVDEVNAAVSAYEEALNANDLSALDAFFWNAPETVRLGVSENLYGFEAIAAFRRGRVGGSPPRTRIRTEILALGHDVAVAHVEFRRDGAGRTGRQSQTWIRTDDGWKIASAHVSLLQDVPDQRS
jgi:ketosteroid isomerase-like protein